MRGDAHSPHSQVLGAEGKCTHQPGVEEGSAEASSRPAARAFRCGPHGKSGTPGIRGRWGPAEGASTGIPESLSPPP